MPANQSKSAPEGTPAAPGPRHSWLGIGIGLTISLAMLVATAWVIGQFLKHRPLDLSGPTREVGEIAVGVLKNLGASEDLIEMDGPHLESTPRAHFYRTRVTAHLPGTVNPNRAVDAIERALLRKSIVISAEDAADTERTTYLSFDGNEVATIHLVHAPSRDSSPHGARLDDAFHMPAAPVGHAEPHTEPGAEDPGADDGSTHETDPSEPAPADPVQPRAMAIPMGLYAPSFGEIAAHGRSKVAQAHPRVAIIVDDGGYGGESTEIILGLDPKLTFAILPNTPLGTTLAQEAARRGFEIMLHMPMDNSTDTLTHPGQIDSSMEAAEIQRLTQEALAQVPGAVGINNHTGSKFTANATAMRHFMQGIQKSGLFFIDSRTTPDTVASDIAREFRVPAAARTLFLDHDNNDAEIRARFRELMQEARAQGYAIGICHFRPNTAAVLRDMLPLLQAEGIQLVHASELVR